MKSVGICGELRQDKFGYVWINNGDVFIELLDGNGENVHSSASSFTMEIPTFPSHEDPSVENPSLVKRLNRIEEKIDRLLNHLNIETSMLLL